MLLFDNIKLLRHETLVTRGTPVTPVTVKFAAYKNANPGDQEPGIDLADPFIDEKLYEWEMEREWGLRG